MLLISAGILEAKEYRLIPLQGIRSSDRCGLYFWQMTLPTDGQSLLFQYEEGATKQEWVSKKRVTVTIDDSLEFPKVRLFTRRKEKYAEVMLSTRTYEEGRDCLPEQAK